MTSSERILTYLEREFVQPVRDPLWKHIYISRGLMRLVDTEAFQQLNRIKQLGPSFLVYPGATHTRLNHSLGVFHIARLMIRRVLSHEHCPGVSMEGVKAFLAAALLHDLGHFPYAHSLKELPLKEHEALTGEQAIEGEIAQRLRDDVGTDPEMVAAIVDETLSHNFGDEVTLYRNILSGTLDPDKLDYLNRDAYFCGVPYGIQDIDFAISRIVPAPQSRLALDIHGVSAVENILFSKYLMYRAVYWHRTVRVATAMIKKAIYLGLRGGEIAQDELYGLDDELFFARFTKDRFPAFTLMDDVLHRRLYKVIFDHPFSQEDPSMAELTDLKARETREHMFAQELARQLGRPIEDHSVIIDIPEPVSFEITMPITQGNSVIDIQKAGTVFTPGVVSDFTRTLRRLRVMVAPAIADELDKHSREDMSRSILSLS